jgi:hypothetical protein
MGSYIVDEYTRRHHRWNASALAEGARVNRGTLDLILKGQRADGTPVQQWPETLRQIAYAIASGDSNPDAGELIYERLLDLAGYLPRVRSACNGVATNADTERQLRQSEAQMRRDLRARWIAQLDEILGEQDA